MIHLTLRSCLTCRKPNRTNKMIIQIDTKSASFQKAFIISTLVASFVCFSLAIAWTGPSGSPPNSNVSAPINVGATSQVKNGALSVNGFSVYGSQYIQGNLGIGTSPSASWAIYSAGNTYASGNSRADGGFCIGGNCKTSWTPDVSTATCSSYGFYQAGCTATCPSDRVMVGGGCYTSGGEWYIWQSYPNGNGWYCAGQEDYGSSNYNQYVYAYARCLK